MELWSRWRADLRRPEVPTSPEERRFLLVAPLAVVVVAQLADPGSPLELALLVPMVAAFAARALWPGFVAEAFAGVVIASMVAAVGRDGDLEGCWFLGCTMVLYCAWDLGSLTRSVAITVATATSMWWVADVQTPEAGIDWHPWAMACAFTFLLGRTVRRQRSLIEQLEQTRRALAATAVAEERRRIARDLHDLAGHTLAAMLLHVTGARHVLRRDPDEAERALRDAEAVGRTSLDQIRATVAALRADEHGTDPALADAADLGPLVEGYRRAGLTIELRIEPSAATATGPAGTAVHRIAREALANVARHAPGNAVTVTLDVDGADLRLVVADRGRAPRTTVPATGTGRHFGLVGMAERARAVGGELEAGPSPDGWRVEARLPRTTVGP